MVIVSEYTLCGIGNTAVIKDWIVVWNYTLLFPFQETYNMLMNVSIIHINS